MAERNHSERAEPTRAPGQYKPDKLYHLPRVDNLPRMDKVYNLYSSVQGVVVSSRLNRFGGGVDSF